MQYRREVDGLRALAILPVLLFHAGFEQFSGGYVGVDIFFVISGYLITTIILVELEQGSFSLTRFYERRMRRILPALFFMMLVTLPLAWLWLFPAEMVDYSQSLIAVSTFVSNILFWQEVGYWEQAAELKPLIHTWSLSVEEQFYLLFPLLLMTVWRNRRVWLAGMLVVTLLISIVAAEWLARHAPIANFYLLPTRLWELVMGALIAYQLFYREALIDSDRLREGLSLLGLLMILYAIFGFDRNTPFPGFQALIPTVGTGLVLLFASPLLGVGRVLGMRPLVGIGLISYSLYLWHQPLLAFARQRSLVALDALTLSGLLVAVFPMAYLSWRYIETPFRDRACFNRKQIFFYSIAASLLFVLIGLAGHLNGGWKERMEEEMVVKNSSPRCKGKTFSTDKVCTLVEGEEGVTLLMGDSHSAVLAHEMQAALSERKLGLWHIYGSGCPPIQNVYRADNPNQKNLSCYRFNQGLYRFIGEHPEIETVILSARWPLSLEGVRFDNAEGGIERSPTPYQPHLDLVVDGEPLYHMDYRHQTELIERLRSSIRQLLDLGKWVILIYPIPEAGWHVPKYLSKYRSYISDSAPLSPEAGSTAYDVFKERSRSSYTALDGIGSHPKLIRIYPEKLFCNRAVEGRCVVHHGGEPLYRDDDHLSSRGSDLIVNEIMKYPPFVRESF